MFRSIVHLDADACFGINAVELTVAFAAVDQTETFLHRHFGSVEEKRTESLRCYGRVRYCSPDLAPGTKLMPVLGLC